MTPAEREILAAAGFAPSRRIPGWWKDDASGEDYPSWRALEIAQRDLGLERAREIARLVVRP